MLHLLCITFDGFVRMKDFDTCVERDEYAEKIERAGYRHVIKINGTYDFFDTPE